jgi:hypothetical protein
MTIPIFTEPCTGCNKQTMLTLDDGTPCCDPCEAEINDDLDNDFFPEG